MRFCDECDNLLDPKEHTLGDKSLLQFECKHCARTQRVTEGSEVENCVYRTDYTVRAEALLVDPECVKDPTLTRRKDMQCKWCNYNEAVSFTQVTAQKLNMIFVCTRCSKWWAKGEGKKDEAELFSDDSN
jgi:DNA-directed RNA polymerase subunit M/transcription elongation factor TFIIS